MTIEDEANNRINQMNLQKRSGGQRSTELLSLRACTKSQGQGQVLSCKLLEE